MTTNQEANKELAGGYSDAAALISAYANDDRQGLAGMMARMSRDELAAAVVGILGAFEYAGGEPSE